MVTFTQTYASAPPNCRLYPSPPKCSNIYIFFSLTNSCSPSHPSPVHPSSLHPSRDHNLLEELLELCLSQTSVSSHLFANSLHIYPDHSQNHSFPGITEAYSLLLPFLPHQLHQHPPKELWAPAVTTLQPHCPSLPLSCPCTAGIIPSHLI